MQFIDLKHQYSLIKDDVKVRMDAVLEHGQYILGPEVGELEGQLAEYVGSHYCVGVSSGTDALLVALMALEVGPGDEGITSPFTFIATAEAIALLGAKPVYVDIDSKTYNIDPQLIEAAITERTKAIMPVSLYGQCADFDAINSIAQKHDLPVIEDAAQSFGAEYQGRKSCNLSTIAATSFFPSKPLGGYGDGGAVFTNDEGLEKLMREISVHGQDRRYHHPRLDINGRLDTLQAAVLISKLGIFADEVAARARIGARYSEALKDVVQVPHIADGCSSVYAQYTIGVEDRDGVQKRMSDQNVPTAVHYPITLDRQPALSQPGLDLPQATRAAERVISLPMHPYLSEEDQDAVIAAVRVAVG